MVKNYAVTNTTDEVIEVPELLILQPGRVDVGLTDEQVAVLEKVKGVEVELHE